MAKNSKQKQREYDAKRSGRTRNWAVILYPEDLPDDWKLQIDETMVRWIESPLHDQDFNADGSPKKPHHHALFMFDAVKSDNQVITFFKDLFGESDSGSIIGVATPKAATDRGSVVRYMAHMDNPEKAQYDPNGIVGHNGADPAELLRYSATETRLMVIAMEEYIEEHKITELADFSKAIRYEHPEWHTLLTTKMTVYFNGLIRSHRHKAEKGQIPNCDPETGEVLD